MYFQIAFSTGLRTSELLALEWEDIDLSNKRITVSRAKVRGQIKGPKTSASKRTVELQPLAERAVRSLMHGPMDGEIFRNPRNGDPWTNGQMLRKGYWYPALDMFGVARRNPYQTRHTFASHMLRIGANPLYVAQQMGHRDWGMIRKVYGRYISTEAGLVRSTSESR